jgi:hypothetical protein
VTDANTTEQVEHNMILGNGYSKSKETFRIARMGNTTRKNSSRGSAKKSPKIINPRV